MKSLKSYGGFITGQGMTESTRDQWVYTMYGCTVIHTAIAIFDLGTKSSRQHEEIGKSRHQCDHEDLAKVTNVFSHHDPSILLCQVFVLYLLE